MMLSVAALVVFLVVFAGIAALVLILVLAALRKGDGRPAITRTPARMAPGSGRPQRWIRRRRVISVRSAHGDATGGHHHGSSVDSGAGHFESGGHSSGDSGSGQSGGDSGSSGGGDSGGGSSSG